jgi:hypothetical protein
MHWQNIQELPVQDLLFYCLDALTKYSGASYLR